MSQFYFCSSHIKGDFKMTKDAKDAKKNSAFMRPVQVSDTLAEVVGRGPMPRTEVTKKLWDYIKKNKLQDQNNKRNINPDAKLAKVLGGPAAIDMFKMTSKIAKHLKEPEMAAKK
jgi:chromatin remodeling complex protein RSC6